MEITDEHGRRGLEFKDWEGKVVCKKVQEDENGTSFLTTYYVYDDFGQLRYSIPPEATDKMATAELATPFVINPGTDATFIGNWLFVYTYDARGRLTEKKVPGAGPVRMLYNNRGQLVMSQDNRQAGPYSSNGVNYPSGQWTFFKYDALGRVVMKGFYYGTISQAELDNLTNLAEKRSNETGSILGYTNEAFPQTTPDDLLAVYYFDDYDYPGAHAFVPFSCAAASGVGAGSAYFARTQGKPTGSRVRMLRSAEQWLVSTPYYDKDGNVIQAIADNHLQSGGTNSKDISFNCYDFAGKLLSSELRHQNALAQGAKSRTVKSRSVYDHAGRTRETYQQIDNGAEERLATYNYNLLGESTQKLVGRGTLQKIDYRYNIRGWLTHINEGHLNADNDKFALTLSYNGPTNPQFNGNISSQQWTSAFDRAQRKYDYQYTPLNQLQGASYGVTGLPAGAVADKFDLPLVQYDKNGNLKRLQRYGITAGTAQKPTAFGLVDDLVYNHQGNQLTNVQDHAWTGSLPQTTPGPARDFVEGSPDGNISEYSYDLNGNLVSDANKGITSIQYNYLNLPTGITFNQDQNRRVVNLYDASGIKRQKIVYTTNRQGSPLTLTTDYVGGMVYQQNVLQFVPTGEGRALSPEVTGEGQFAYEYQYVDHLGNLRMSFRKAPDVPPYTATMETAFAITEEATFDNVSTTRNGTQYRTGSQSSQLNKDQVLGPWRTFVVRKGDVVTARAYAHYASSATAGTRVQLQPYLEAYGGSYPSTGEKTGNSYPQLLAGVRANVAPPTQSSGVPVAYLKWILYDQAGSVVADGSKIRPVTAAALTSWEELKLDFVMPQDGQLQVLVANESEQHVWFDDIEIRHTQDLVVQENHYDPWGMELVGIQKAGTPEDPWKFQGKELVSDVGLEWSDFSARYYDPQLGRWHAADPADQFASPYLAMGNNPVVGVDPDGQWVHIAIGAVVGGVINVATHWGKITTGGNPLKDGAVAFGIGAVAGGVGAATGGAAFAGAGGAAALGATATAGSGGFVAGAVGGVIGSVSSGQIQGIGNAIYFGDAFSPTQWITDGVIGGLTAGTLNGGMAVLQGGKFWTGIPKTGLGELDAASFRLLRRNPEKYYAKIEAAKKAEAAAAKSGDELSDLFDDLDYMKVYHKGELVDGVVSTNRSLSTGLDKSAVEALNRPGQVWEFKIPRNEYNRWFADDLVQRFTDLDQVTGVVNQEIRFSPKLAPQLNKYIVK